MATANSVILSWNQQEKWQKSKTKKLSKRKKRQKQFEVFETLRLQKSWCSYKVGNLTQHTTENPFGKLKNGTALCFSENQFPKLPNFCRVQRSVCVCLPDRFCGKGRESKQVRDLAIVESGTSCRHAQANTAVQKSKSWSMEV